MHNTASNEAEVQAYFAAIATFSTDGNPWTPSKNEMALRKVYGCPVVKDIVKGKVYLVQNSITVYNSLHGHGTYYTRGTIVMVGDDVDEVYVNVEVHGGTFAVTSNPGFANQSATWIHGKGGQQGIANKDRIYLVEIADALAAISN